MSSAEALVRVQRLLSAKGITLVLCGLEVDSAIGKSLESVGLLGADRVEVFTTFNDAMECEWYVRSDDCGILTCRQGLRISICEHGTGVTRMKFQPPLVFAP